MADVIPLPAQPFRCDCGSEHFRLTGNPLPPAITLNRAGDITTYAGTVLCDECGTRIEGESSWR